MRIPLLVALLAMLENGVRFNIAATGLKIMLAGQPGCKAR